MANAEEHLRLIREADEAGAELILGPEMGLTGYDVRDLMKSTTLERKVYEAIEWLCTQTANISAIIVIGAPVIVDTKRANAAVVMSRGKLLAIIPKTYLADGNEFYDRRVFAPARLFQSSTVWLCDQNVPFGTDILVQGLSPDLLIGLEICEDGWAKISPGSVKMMSGATLIGNLSASNDLVGKGDTRLRDVVLGPSSLGYCAYMYTSIGPGDSTSGLVFGGHCMIADRGSLLIERRDGFDRKGGILVADIDLEAIRKDRLGSSSFQECSSDFGKQMRIVRSPHAVVPYVKGDLMRRVAPHPFVPSDPKDRDARCAEVERNMVEALVHKLESLPLHMRKLVIGASGGKDSSLALKIAAIVMDRLGLPRTNVIAITMPGFGTGSKTYRYAVELMERLGVTRQEVSIKPLAEQMLGVFDYDFGKKWEERTQLERATFENVQAITRFVTLASFAWWNGGIVDGTGTMTELALGWCTMFADHASHYNAQGGVPKTLIRYFLHWLADARAEGEECKLIHEIADQDASPELKPLEEGEAESTQISEDLNGPYELHDFFLYYFLRFGFAADKIVFMAWHAFRAGVKAGICDREYSVAEIKKWMLKFLRNFFANQFKRNCVPESPMVGSVSLDPRGYWRMPSDAEVQIWIEEVEAIDVE
jgi:NAD+ synthase (glutamine-hydrolysing)